MYKMNKVEGVGECLIWIRKLGGWVIEVWDGSLEKV